MKERPILFNDEMVRATLDGRKTHTRRIIKSPAKNMQQNGAEVIRRNPDNDPWYKDHVWSMRTDSGMWGDYTHDRFLQFCPFGKVGDRLWVREAHFVMPHPSDSGLRESDIPSTWDHACSVAGSVVYRADRGLRGFHPMPGLGWKPSIHMRREHSRITLEITSIRVDRLQDISEEDAVDEGCQAIAGCKWHTFKQAEAGIPMHDHTALDAFEVLWESINGPGSWDANPWVWVVEFKRI